MVSEREELLVAKCKITLAELKKLGGKFISSEVAMTMAPKVKRALQHDGVFYNSKLVSDVLAHPKLGDKTAIMLVIELRKIFAYKTGKQVRNGLGANKKVDRQFAEIDGIAE